MNAVLKKQEEIKDLNITLLELRNSLKTLKNEKETTFSIRELNYSKDDSIIFICYLQ